MTYDLDAFSEERCFVGGGIFLSRILAVMMYNIFSFV